MIERVTIEAREIRAGDRFHTVPGKRGRVASVAAAAGPVVTGGKILVPAEAVEVFTDDDPMGMPLTFGASDPVTVWREVSR